jgi:hypothetical protein
MSKASDLLWKVCKVLPQDYSVERWADDHKVYPDCSGGCRWFVPLENMLGADWGVCANPQSHRAGLLTWEHQAGVDCFEMAPEEWTLEDWKTDVEREA